MSNLLRGNHRHMSILLNYLALPGMFYTTQASSCGFTTPEILKLRYEVKISVSFGQAHYSGLPLLRLQLSH